MITKLHQLIEAARAQGRKRIAVAYAQDLHTIEAIELATREGLVDAILIGNRVEIETLCHKVGTNPWRFTIEEANSDVECVARAVSMVRSGHADIMMKGLVPTDRYMRGILSRENGLVPQKGVLSHVTVLEVPTYHKLLLVSDVAVIPYPDLGQKQAMIKYLIETAHALGIEVPKVACIAPSEQMLPGIASCYDAAILSKMGDRGQLGKAFVDGPLALDAAICPDVVEIKKIKGSSAAGDADCLLFPNIDAANVFFKSMTKLCGGELAAMVVGAKAPCVLTSRGDTPESKLYSIALACLCVK